MFRTGAVTCLRASRARSLVQARGISTMQSKANANWANTAVAGSLLAAAGALYYSTVNNGRVHAEPKKEKKALTGGDEWVEFKIADIRDDTHDVKTFVFELPEKDQVLGLETASCVLTKFLNSNGKNVIRPYTPTSSTKTAGHFDLVVKKYEKGLMSKHLHSLKVGDTVSFKGPILKYKWEANKHDSIGLIGGGSGVTPLYQLVQEIASNPKDLTKVIVFLGNKSKDDLLLQKELDWLVSKKPDQITIHYFLDEAYPGFKGQQGFITKDYLSRYMFKPDAGNVHVFVCGPPGLYEAMSGNKASPSDQGELTGALKDLGFTKDQVFKF